MVGRLGSQALRESVPANNAPEGSYAGLAATSPRIVGFSSPINSARITSPYVLAAGLRPQLGQLDGFARLVQRVASVRALGLGSGSMQDHE